MDNVSEALLMIGGILLAILTISTLVFMFNNISIIQGTQLNKEETQRLVKWNSEWEAYNKKLLYATEVFTVINKAKQNNEEYSNNDEYYVNVDVYLSDGVTKVTNPEDYIKNLVDSNQNKIYSCVDMTLNANTGRIQNIKFKSIE